MGKTTVGEAISLPPVSRSPSLLLWRRGTIRRMVDEEKGKITITILLIHR
jgi:hypothetical protein